MPLRWKNGAGLGLVLFGAKPQALPFQSACYMHQKARSCYSSWWLWAMVFILCMFCGLLVSFQQIILPNVRNTQNETKTATNVSHMITLRKLLDFAPPVMQAWITVVEKGTEGKSLGQFLDAVEQAELFIDVDDTDPIKAKIEMLRGNPHSKPNSSTEKQLRRLAIPTRWIDGKWLQYKLKGGWWTPPRRPGPNHYLHPLPYTGWYDAQGRRWVNYEGQRREWHSLPWSERLARTRKPWCLQSEQERKELIEMLEPGISWQIREAERQLERGRYGWLHAQDIKYWTVVKEYYMKMLEGKIAIEDHPGLW
ncbi:uncharacterized protein [Marmota flaviventris]|uniref:uncharacterized protein isoform X1 n=1 Tax=Marmota flaviventris TaxID=93162 RepID=UPI003A871259